MISGNGALTKMKTYRDTFEENFKAVPELLDNGRVRMHYIYIGLWYVWNLPGRRVKAIKRLVGLAFALSALLFFTGGLTDSFLNYARYVKLPGMLSIAALVFEAFGAIQFCAANERMTCMDFRDIRTKLLIAPVMHSILLVCAVIAAVSEAIHRSLLARDIAVMLCYFCSALSSLAVFLCIRSLPYIAVKNENEAVGLEDKE